MTESERLLEAAHAALREYGQKLRAAELAQQILDNYPDSPEAEAAKRIIHYFSPVPKKNADLDAELDAVSGYDKPEWRVQTESELRSGKVLGGVLVLAIIGAIFWLASGSLNSDPETKQMIEPQRTEKHFSPTADDVIGQWRSVAENPSRPNTVANRYMRHTFFGDGTVVVENKEDSQNNGTWEFVDGFVIVSSSYKTSLFTETYEFRGRDELLKTRFQSIVGGEPMADYDPDDSYIRQGSDREKSMRVWDVFAEVSDRMNFVDPNALEIGKTYTLSRNTPLAPHIGPVGSSLEDVMSEIKDLEVIDKGGKILILEKKQVEYQIWYNVQVGEHTGWVKSTALFGQDLQ